MDPQRLKEMLERVRRSETSIDEALEELTHLPFAAAEDAHVDHHRALRTGFPEVVFGEGKTVSQLISIVTELERGGHNVLVTRLDADRAAAVREKIPHSQYQDKARCLVLRQKPVEPSSARPIAVITAGTSDVPVAEEAALTAELAGNEVMRIYDVGVAGVHRLLGRLQQIRSAAVLVVVAGMEGALPSVVSGLVSAPVIAVPTSVGYGASFNGVTALLAMLSSCAAGVTVVNIDNGFGAGYAAATINRIGAQNAK